MARCFGWFLFGAAAWPVAGLDHAGSLQARAVDKVLMEAESPL